MADALRRIPRLGDVYGWAEAGWAAPAASPEDVHLRRDDAITRSNAGRGGDHDQQRLAAGVAQEPFLVAGEPARQAGGMHGQQQMPDEATAASITSPSTVANTNLTASNAQPTHPTPPPRKVMVAGVSPQRGGGHVEPHPDAMAQTDWLVPSDPRVTVVADNAHQQYHYQPQQQHNQQVPGVMVRPPPPAPAGNPQHQYFHSWHGQDPRAQGIAMGHRNLTYPYPAHLQAQYLMPHWQGGGGGMYQYYDGFTGTPVSPILFGGDGGGLGPPSDSRSLHQVHATHYHPHQQTVQNQSSPQPPNATPPLSRLGPTGAPIPPPPSPLPPPNTTTPVPSSPVLTPAPTQPDPQPPPSDHQALQPQGQLRAHTQAAAQFLNAQIRNFLPSFPSYSSSSSTGVRRMKTHKVPGKGKYSIDLEVSPKLLEADKVRYTKGSEFTHMRYTACTCQNPDDFPREYTLRVKAAKRKIRIAVVVTMYNENDVLFAKSFTAIMKNIAYLCSGRCMGWDKNGWKEIVLCIVSDGRSKANPSTLNLLEVMGCFRENVAKASVDGVPVTAHIFEYTNQASVTKNLQIRWPNDSERDGLKLFPCQTIFLLKEKNAKKINSHRWFFNAVCQQLQPEVCILIDCGTKPFRSSFYHLYRAFERNPNVAGACGEIAAELGECFWKLVNPIVAVQNFEYNAEDRILCFELVVKQGSQNVLKYVKHAKAETDVPSTLHDLIKQRRRWLNGSFFASLHATLNFMRIYRSGHRPGKKLILTIEFLYNAINLLFTWFNLGNFFLSFYFLFNVAADQTTATCQLASIETETDPFYPNGHLIFNVVRTVYIFAVVTVFIAALGNRPEGSRILYTSFTLVFAALMGLMLFMGAWTVKVSVMTYIDDFGNSSDLWTFLKYMWQSPAFRDIVVSLLATYGVYLVASIMFMDPWHVFTCMLQYLFMLPSFVNILTVYAFCNLHDVTWGTRPEDPVDLKLGCVTVRQVGNSYEADVEMLDEDERKWDDCLDELQKQSKGLRKRKDTGGRIDQKTKDEDGFRQFRTNTLFFWLLTNGILVYVFTSPSIIKAIFPRAASKQSVNPYLTFLFWAVAFMAFFRFICATVYLVKTWYEGVEDAGKRREARKANRQMQHAMRT
ncbi:Chitin synthase, class 2 [Phlyctochytrium bullatum]|nr:Chitin synthase, class 2 [Phlyctochytrium bullatum]